MGLNPHTAMLWGGKHSFLLVSADKQGQAVLLVTCRQRALSDDRGMLLVTWPPNCATAHYGCAEGCDRQRRQRVAVAGVQLDGFGF